METTVDRSVLLQSLRLAAELTQEELASKAAVTQQAIAMLERGRRRGRAGTWIRIARALDVDETLFLIRQQRS